MNGIKVKTYYFLTLTKVEAFTNLGARQMLPRPIRAESHKITEAEFNELTLKQRRQK